MLVQVKHYDNMHFNLANFGGSQGSNQSPFLYGNHHHFLLELMDAKKRLHFQRNSSFATLMFSAFQERICSGYS